MPTTRGPVRTLWTRIWRALKSPVWWTEQISFSHTLGLMMLVTLPVAILAVPSKVSVDGIYYVLGAKTLFTSDFSTLYPLFREPGYPAFLAFIHLFSGASLFVVVAQAALLTFASFAGLYVIHRALGRTTITRYVFIIGLAFTLNPIYFTYAGHFMQQSFFAGLLAAYAVLVEWSRKQPPRIKKWQVFALIVVLNFVTIWSSIGWLYLGLFATLLALCYLFVPTVWRFQRRGVRIVSAVLLVGAISGATFAADRAIYAGWERLRDAQTATNAINPVVLKPLETAPGLPSPGKALSLYATLNGIGITDPYPKENDQFLGEQMRLRFYQSEWDTAYVREPYTSAALGYFNLNDPSLVAHTIYALGSQPIGGFLFPGVVYSLVMVLGHVVALIALIRRQWFVFALLLIPVSWLAVYALSNTPIDRYGIPAYPLLAGAVAFACDRLWWRRNQGEKK